MKPLLPITSIKSRWLGDEILSVLFCTRESTEFKISPQSIANIFLIVLLYATSGEGKLD